MSFLVKATVAPKPRSIRAGRLAVGYAAILVIMAVAQLFTFEDFLVLLTDFGLPMGALAAYILGSTIVVLEVFSLPFLLRFPLSRAFRWISLVCGWLVAAVWLKVSLWVVITQPAVDNIGFLGSVVSLPPGWWAVCLSIALGALAAWAAWGLWPGRRSK